MRRSLTWARILLLVLAVSACTPTPLVTDGLDAVTGVTVTQSTEPFILYRDESFRRGDDRDLVYIGPLQVNRMGDYKTFLWLGILSLERYGEMKMNTEDFADIEILADNTVLNLEVTGWTPAAIGMSEQVYKQVPEWAESAYYEVSVEQLHTLALANEIRLRTTAEIAPSYEPWSNQTQALSALREFVVFNDY